MEMIDISQPGDTDVVGLGPAATSLMHYTDGSVRPFARRERPALMVDEKGFPTHLYTGIQAPGMNYSCHSATDRGCHCWSSVQATVHGARSREQP